jgi:Tfp pilus assembly protein PilE
METDVQSDVPARTTSTVPRAPVGVIEYRSPAPADAGKERGRRRFLEYLVVIAICAVLITLLMPALPRKARPAARTANVAQASQYMAALTRHFAEKGTYPAKLDDLAPQYLPALPQATRGTKWWYRTYNNGTAYQLEWMQYRHLWRYDSVTDKVTERQVRGQ